MKPTVELDGGRIKLWHADCLDVLPLLPEGSVDAVVTDPPYFLPARHYNTRKEFPRSLTDLRILETYFREIFSLIHNATARDGCWYVFCDGQSYPVFYATAYTHSRRLVPLVWDKGTSINGYSWRHQHELIMFCERDNYPAIKTGDGDVLRCSSVPIDDREHPAEKPIDLVARLISKSAHRNPFCICDPFMGGGTTGIAAVREGCEFVGIEGDDRYFDIAVKRIQDELSRTPLFPDPKPKQTELALG